jgi:HAE1 family hydrophobic/amphiphilic exporter-1
VAPEMAAKIAKLDGVLDVETDLSIKNPQMTVEIDRERAAIYGITIEQVRQEMFNAFGTRQVATIFTSDNDYPIILETLPEFQTDTSALSRIHIKTAGGTSVPLESVTRIRPTVGPLLVNHQASQPAVTISFNLRPGYSLGAAVEAIKDIERDSNLPATIATGFQGTAQVFEDSKKGQPILLLAAIFAAYVLLGILYESFIQPIVIISGLPSAGVGALLTLIVFKMDLSVIAMIGVVMLVGIVMKNAIMMLDFAVTRRKVGLSAEAAIQEAAKLRFRPIMMTTFSAIFGTLPIALGAGAGAELRQPLGIAVVGGLCFSQLLTLYITPVIYTYLDGLDRLLKRRLDPPKDELPEELEPIEHRPVAAE